MTTLQHDAIPPRLSDEQLLDVLDDLARVQTLLAEDPQVGDEARKFIRELPLRLHADAPGGVISPDAFLSEQVYAGVALAAAALLEDSERVARRQARLALEQVRQALRDIAEGRPLGDDRPASELVLWLEATLDAGPTKLAELVGTTPRTWQRWRTGEQIPDDVGQLRLRRLVGAVAHLRFSLTAAGVVDWFQRPHPALKGGQGTPAELLDDAEGYRTVLDLAARLRTMTAT